MDDMTAFERQVARRFQHHAGPVRPVNDAAIFTAITATRSPKWRFTSMFSATKFLVAGVIVALFGGFLLSGVLTRPAGDTLPAAMSIGASCPEAEAYRAAAGSGVTASGTLATPVHGTGYLDEAGVDEQNTVISEADGYARITFLIEQEAEADDPRLSGHFSGEVTAHFFDGSTGVVVGQVHIENESGSWVGNVRGQSTDVEPWGAYHIDLVGDGAYSGCAASFGTSDESGGGDMLGVIYPLEAVEGTE